MFNDKLKELRREKGLTQDELASKIYVSRSLIAKYETGAVYPSKENLEKLALFFNVDVNDLIDTNEVTLEVAKIKSTSYKINLICLIAVIVISTILAILIFIPMFKGFRYIYPIPEGQSSPDIEYYWVSIFSGNMMYGNPQGILSFISLLIPIVSAILSIIFMNKGPILPLLIITYIVFFLSIILFFVALINCYALNGTLYLFN